MEHSHSRLVGVLLVVLPASLALVLSLLLINRFLSDLDDNARYMILAQSLATGHGFTLISEPEKPWDKLYPYGYPALLAVQMLLFGSEQDLAAVVRLLKLSNSILFAGSVALAYRLALASASRPIAVSSTLLTAISPLVLRYSADVMSEIPFLFFSLLAIITVEKAVKGRGSSRMDVAAAATLALAFYMRTVGAVLVITAMICVFKRQPEGFSGAARQAVRIGLFTALFLVPWFHQQAVATPGGDYWTQFTTNVSHPSVDASGSDYGSWDKLLKRSEENLRGYVFQQIPRALLPHLSGRADQEWLVLERVLGLVVLALVALGWATRARAGPGVAEIYVLVSLLALSLWWQVDRFLVPLIPLLALFLASGLHRVAVTCGRLKGASESLLMALLILPFVISALSLDYFSARANLQRLDAGSPSEYLADTMPDFASYFLAAEWLRTNSPPEAVVMSMKPRLMFVYSGRRTVDSPRRGDIEEVLLTVKTRKVDYVVEDSFIWNRATSRVVTPALRAEQERFTLVYTAGEPITNVWRYDRSVK